MRRRVSHPTVRRPRGVAGSAVSPGGLTVKEGLIWVDGHTLYINGSAAGLVLSEGRKQLISMGAWLLICRIRHTSIPRT